MLLGDVFMDQNNIGNFISKLRKEKGLTQNDIAYELGVTDKAVSKWERGLGCPDISLLIPLSDILEVSVNELLLGKKIKENISKKQADDAIKETIKLSDNKIRKNLKRNKILKIIICIVVTLLLIGTFFVVRNYKEKAAKKEELKGIVIKVQSNLNKLKFVKDNPSKSPNYILEDSEITYVIPEIKYKPNNQSIYKEILSYSDYNTYSGIIVYYNNTNNVSVYYHTDDNDMLVIPCDKKGNYIGKENNKTDMNFYKENELEIKERIEKIQEIWLKVYK